MDEGPLGRLAFAVLLLNITLVLLGVLSYAWQARREASSPLPPTNRAELTVDGFGTGRS
jgi:hypothetical protein